MKAKCALVGCLYVAMVFMPMLPHHPQTTSCHDSRKDEAIG